MFNKEIHNYDEKVFFSNLGGSVNDDVFKLLELNKLREELLDFFLSKYKNDKRIKSAKIFGSTSSKNFTIYSDVDLLLVVNDNFLESLKLEIITYLSTNRKFLWKWGYSDNHFYLVFDYIIPIDLYIISESESRSIISKKDKKDALYHILSKQTGITELFSNEGFCEDIVTPQISNEKEEVIDIYIGYFQMIITRLYRLLSKFYIGEYVEFAYIMNSIREDNLVPLFSFIGLNFPNAKKLIISELPPEIIEPFINTFVRPRKEDCYIGLINFISIIKELLNKYIEINGKNIETKKLQIALDYTLNSINNVR